MSNSKIFARAGKTEFVGRAAELDLLVAHASKQGGLALLSVPHAGTSELLRQAFDRLFTEQTNVIPFYFEVKPSDRTIQNTARRFVSEFLTQMAAFGRRDAHIINISPAIGEIAEIAAPDDEALITSLIETFAHGDGADNRSFARNCLSVPIRAALNGARSFVMIDDLHAASYLDDGDAFVEDLTDIFSRAPIPFVFAGQRRFLFAKTPFETISIEPVSFADAGKLVEHLSAKMDVAINDQTRDLIAVQLGGIPAFIEALFASALAGENDLNSFDVVEQTYTDEIFGGRISKHFDAVFDRILPDAGVQLNVLRLLSQTMTATAGKVPATYWKKHAGLDDAKLTAAFEALRCSEVIDVSSGSVSIDPSNIVLRDYLIGRARLEIDGVSRALAVGEAVSEHVKRATELMARFYRRNSSIGLRELLQTFDGRKVSPVLIDYAKFKEQFKGSSDEKILKSAKEDNAKVTLAHIVYTAHTGDFYSKLNELCDIEASAVALGFTYADGQEETAWIAAEIESKLEASRDLVEFWCDRLEMAAVHCGFERFKLWLVAPEGFAPDAVELLRVRDAYGSSVKQVELLAGILGAEIPSQADTNANEYEFVFPMGENTEMIAAHTVEEIAKRHAFPVKAINQIKTALVEACINASEHSLSPDRKIYQKFVVDDDKLTITVSNRGVRLADKVTKAVAPEIGRRGWGLKLIKGLMDEVSLDQVDDGTRITMVKLLKQA